MDKKERDYYWQRFYQEERDFLFWIANQSNCLLNLDNVSLSLSDTDDLPQFIRQVHIVPSELLDEAKKRYLKTKAAFLDVSEFTDDNKLRLPSRLPQIYTNVERIIHSSYPAYQSIKVKRIGECDLHRTEPYMCKSDEDIGLLAAETVCGRLHGAGLTTAFVRFVPANNCHAVTVDSEQFHTWAGCESIQRRSLTGLRYEARISEFGKRKPIRTHLGLILLCQDTTPFADESLPRQRRSDADSKRPITLPIESKYTFFSND